MRVLVTGANGYVGRHLCESLKQSGYDVIATARNAGEAGVTGVGNITASTDWRPTLSNVDVVIHTAAVVHQSGSNSESRREVYFEVNDLATQNLAHQASESGVKRFIFFSTAAVYGPYQNIPFRETDMLHPESDYGLSKLLAEEHLNDIESEMSCISLRCPMIYGPSAPGSYRFLSKLVRSGLPLPLKSVQNQRSFLGIDTLQEGVLRLLSSPDLQGKITLNFTEPPATTADLIRYIAYDLDRPLRLFSIPASVLQSSLKAVGMAGLASKLLSDYLLCADEFQSLLQWCPEGPLHKLSVNKVSN